MTNGMNPGAQPGFGPGGNAPQFPQHANPANPAQPAQPAGGFGQNQFGGPRPFQQAGQANPSQMSTEEADTIAAARDVVGEANAACDAEVTMGSEDMADLLRVVPGAFFTLGHAGGVPLHNPGFIFDDGILPVGASIFARIVERRGAATAGN